jgi:hypothetical protein
MSSLGATNQTAPQLLAGAPRHPDSRLTSRERGRTFLEAFTREGPRLSKCQSFAFDLDNRLAERCPPPTPLDKT